MKEKEKEKETIKEVTILKDATLFFMRDDTNQIGAPSRFRFSFEGVRGKSDGSGEDGPRRKRRRRRR